MSDEQKGYSNSEPYEDEYLSRSHRDDLACGCPTAALAADAMVGAIILARASDDRALSDEVLDQTRAWLEAQAGDQGRRHAGKKQTSTPSGTDT